MLKICVDRISYLRVFLIQRLVVELDGLIALGSIVVSCVYGKSHSLYNFSSNGSPLPTVRVFVIPVACSFPLRVPRAFEADSPNWRIHGPITASISFLTAFQRPRVPLAGVFRAILLSLVVQTQRRYSRCVESSPWNPEIPRRTTSIPIDRKANQS